MSLHISLIQVMDLPLAACLYNSNVLTHPGPLKINQLPTTSVCLIHVFNYS